MKVVPFKLRKTLVRLFYHKPLAAVEEKDSFNETLKCLETVLVNNKVTKFKAFPAGALEHVPLEIRGGDYLDAVKKYLSRNMSASPPCLTQCRHEIYSNPSKPQREQFHYIAITHKSQPDAEVPFEGLFLQFMTKR